MSETPEVDALQFEKAEYEKPQPAEVRCSNCGQVLREEYYQVGLKIACRPCRDVVDAAINGAAGGFRRFRRATLFGMLAAVIGTTIWYGVLALAKLELGLIGIIVGLMVGGAVRYGSEHRGGWRYQLLAMVLTYSSICCTYIPFVWKGIQESIRQQDAAAASRRPATTVAPQSTTARPNPAPASASGAATTSSNASTAAPPTNKADPSRPASGQARSETAGKPSPARMALGLAVLALVLFGIACAVPFLSGFQNIMGLIIIGIALYESWKMNRRTATAIAGPFRVGAQGASTTDGQWTTGTSA